jgi:hypothetical protein
MAWWWPRTAAQRDDVLVVEAHPVEDLAQVLRALRRVGQPPVRRAARGLRVGSVGAPERVGHLRPAHELDRLAAGQRPQVGVRHRRVLLLDALEQVVDDEQPCAIARARVGGRARRRG